METVRILALTWALLLCFTACAHARNTPVGQHANPVRVRKELRSLTATEYNLLVTGLSTMLGVPTSTGQAIYGKQYKAYDYFIVKHAVAVNDPLGDQGHAGSCFMTFHRAWLLEFEQALLSVVPGLKALPYWDITLDNQKGGKYYDTPNYIYSNKWAGAIDQGPSYGYAVKDGIFAWRQVQKFNWALYQQYAWIYNGSLTTGLLRSPPSILNTTYVTRFPSENLFKQGNTSLLTGKRTLPLPNPDWGLPSYPRAAYIKCTDASLNRNWTAWGYCLDISTVPPELLSQYYDDSSFLHVGPHWFVGSLSQQGGQQGDFFDVATSPNEILLFFSHHANIDRNNMMWQINLAKRFPSMVTSQVMYGYPASAKQYPYDVPGCYLYDVVNANFPFTDIFGTPTKPSGYTHWDVLQNTRPLVNAPYTYDTIAQATRISGQSTTTAGTEAAVADQGAVDALEAGASSTSIDVVEP